MSNRTVSVALKAEVSGFVGGMKTAGSYAKGLSDDLGKLGKDSPGKLNDVAMVAGGLGTALLGAAGAAVKMAMDFDKQMSAVSAATKASASDLGKLRQAALDAGAATVFSATDAAKAETELAKAGLKTQEILTGGLNGALALAAAGQMDVAEAAEVSASAMTQFGLKGKDIPHIADLLAAGAGKAQGSVHDMGAALNQAGLIANQFGLSIEETTGTLAAFASAGMTGSDSGTSFKTMLLALANPSKQSAALMRELGIHAYDTSGKFVGLKDLAGQLQEKLGGLTQAQRDQALGQIFGSDAIRAANVLYKQGADGIQKWTDEVNDSGYAADQAARMTDNLAGDLERLRGSIETLAIDSGSGAAGGLRFLTQTMDHLIGQFSAMPSAVNGTVVGLAGIGGASLLAITGLLKVRQTLNDASDALIAMGPRGEKTAGALGAVTKWGGRAVGVFAALQIGGALLSTAMGDGAVNADKLAAGLERVAKTGELGKVGGGAGQFGKDVKFVNSQGGLEGAKNASNIEGIFGISGFSWSVTASANRVKAADDALAKMVQSGNAEQAAKAYAVLAAEAEKNGVSHEKFAAMMPSYTAALGSAATSATAAAAATEAHAKATSLMDGTIGEAIDKLGGFKDAFDALHGSVLAILDTEIAAEQAIDDLTETLASNAHTLDLNTEAGRNNMLAVEKSITTARDAAQAKFMESGSVDAATATYNGYIDRLRASMLAAGYTKAQVDALIATYAKMPPLVQTQVTAPGLVEANNTATGYRRQMEAMDGKVVTTRVVTAYVETGRPTRPGIVGFNRWGGAYEHARWGGLTEHAATGLLKDAALYSPMGPARYAFAEPATQGEAFIPKSGNYGRSMSILNHAAGWYGAQVVPGGGGGESMTNINLTVNAGFGTNGHEVGQQILSVLRPAIAQRGGNVQLVLTGKT